mgnify:CR=1 FL=1
MFKKLMEYGQEYNYQLGTEVRRCFILLCAMMNGRL